MIYKHIAKKSVKQITKPPKRRASRYSFSTVATPECSQGLTQIPNQTGISELVRLIRTRLTPDQNFGSNDETDDKNTKSFL